MEEALNQAVGGIGLLERLGAYLRLFLELENERKTLVFVWDHEMIHELLHPFESKSVYSGLLWYGLQSLRDSASLGDADSWRVIIPEGTKQELQNYLSRLLEKYDLLLKGSAPDDSDKPATAGALELLGPFDRKDYKEVLRAISQLKDLERAVAKLLVLFQRYARPLPFGRDDVPFDSMAFYIARLERNRKLARDISRNEADALNLACTDKLASDDHNISPVLITATGAVRAADKHLTNDPLFFALAAHYIRLHPTPEARRRVIGKAVAHIQNLINRAGDARVGSDEPFTPRAGVAEFLVDLVNLAADPFLIDLANLSFEAQQATNISAAQVRSAAQEIAALRMRSGKNPEHIIDIVRAALSARLSGPQLPELNWAEPFEITEEPQTLVDAESGPVVEAAKIPEGIAVAWRTYEDLDGFFDNLNKFASESRDRVGAFALRYAGRLGVKTVIPDNRDRTCVKTDVIASEQKSTLIRADLSDATVWYHPGDFVFGDELYEDGPPESRPAPTRMALHIYSAHLCALSARLVARTSTRGIDGGRLATSLEKCFNRV
jgi:hypothetical protein